ATFAHQSRCGRVPRRRHRRQGQSAKPSQLRSRRRYAAPLRAAGGEVSSVSQLRSFAPSRLLGLIGKGGEKRGGAAESGEDQHSDGKLSFAVLGPHIHLG